MEKSESKTDLGKAIGEIGAALFELRDALVDLSLTLKDWQFENDLERREKAEVTVQQLLKQIMSAQDPSS